MSDYEFAGIAHAEANDRHDEHPTGVPPAGRGASLIEAPLKERHFWTSVRLQNTGEVAVEARLKHGGAEKSVAAEPLTALMASTTVCRGQLQFGEIVAGSVVITEDGDDYTDDDADGILYDAGGTQRGTINYTTGAFELTLPGAVVEPITAAYDHEDVVDFQTAQQTTAKAAAAYPFTLQTTYGRVVPGSVSIAESGGAKTFVDDGKGNIIETTAGSEADVGSIDYATGLITLTAGSGALAGTVTATYRFNPFAALLAKAGGAKVLDVFGGGQIPELSVEPWADGIKGETILSLWGVARESKGGSLKTRWSHFGDDPIEVSYPYSEVAIGGETNNPPA
jgi:hypothetical protein